MQPQTNRLIESLRDGVGRAVQSLRDASNSRGAAPLHAFIRQGVDEIGNNLLPAFPESPKPQPEMGQLFEPTPWQIQEGLNVNRDYLNDRLGPPVNSVELQPQKELER